MNQQGEYLYRQIADSVRQEIITGARKPGERLPSIRAMTRLWDCTIGTVQRAYRELAAQGLIETHAGGGTKVLAPPPTEASSPLKQIALTNKLEAFFLQAMSAGYELADLESAYDRVMDRWRSLPDESPALKGSLRFSGSHDLFVTWLAGHMSEISSGYRLELRYTGSLGGLQALSQNEADLAGCHLWDPQSEAYNESYVRRLLPDRQTALVTLSCRRLGWILQTGNPFEFSAIGDLQAKGMRFVNRQPGSGTRISVDARLSAAGIDPASISGYEHSVPTHTDVARAIVEGQADIGFGLEAAARSFDLDFIPIHYERYDLVVPQQTWDQPAFQNLLSWLKSSECGGVVASFPGYDSSETGQVLWIN